MNAARAKTYPAPSPPSTSSGLSRWSWGSHPSNTAGVSETPVQTVDDDEYERIVKARQRLARREIELRQIIRYCNGEMDVVRQKLCKDLEVMEIIKSEIEQAGTGLLREQLEEDFHNGMTLI
jgi:hypothetical protein